MTEQLSGPLTSEERQTLKAAAFGVVYLVSNADPGFFAVIRESFAASGALAGSTGLVREVLTTGDLPKLRRGSAAEVEATVLPALRRSVAILAAKAPQELENYRSTVLTAADRVASAARGVNERERAVITKVRDALGVT